MLKEIKLNEDWLHCLADIVDLARNSESHNETQMWLIHLQGYIKGTIELLELKNENETKM